MSKFTKEKYKYLENEIPKLINNGKNSNEISKILNISKSAIFRICTKLQLNIPNHHNKLKFDNTVFDEINTEEKAYWLGFLYADGNVSNNNNSVSISLKGSDKDHLEKFKTFLKASTQIYNSKIIMNNKQYSVCKFYVCDKYFKERLIKLGCVPKKSLILTFPEKTIFKTESLIYDFIRGYVDGDGCLSFSRNGRLSLTLVGTKEMLLEITKIFPGMFASIYQPKRLHNNTWIIQNCGEHADEVTYKLYANAKIFLDRKYERFAVLNRKV